VRLVTPAPPPTDASKKREKPKIMTIDEAHVRVSLFSLLFGSRVMTFGAEAFDGSIDGEVSDSESERNVELELEELDLSQAPLVGEAIGLPAFGRLSGTAVLDSPEARLSKAQGNVSLKITDLAVGDGKAKIRDTIALPRIEAGELVLEAEVTGGQLTIEQFSATGPDLEFVADGTVRLRDQPEHSSVVLNVKFKFTERYTNKNDLTKSLFGAGTTPGLFDLDPKNKRAKRADGFYGWRVSGSVSKPIFTPSSADAGAASRRRKAPKAR
jgi:type II secretion system protein N